MDHEVVAFVRHLRKYLTAREESITEVIANGLESWDDYQRMVGRLEGVRYASRELEDILAKMTRAEGDDPFEDE